MTGDAAEDRTTLARRRWRTFAWTSFAGLLAAFVFVGFPQIDFAVTDLFYQGNRAFVLNFPGAGKDLRVFLRLIFLAATIVALLGFVLAAFYKRGFLSLGFPQWLYVLLCLAIGPGIVANVVLKDHWGRARPFHVQEYGGGQTFTPALVRSDQCEDNCSFVSGEASSIFMLFFALAPLARRRHARLIALGILGGLLAGFIRIAQGGHFLSDVVFAGVFMALIAEGLHWLVFGLGARALEDEGPVHRALFDAGRGTSRAVHHAASWASGALRGLLAKRAGTAASQTGDASVQVGGRENE